jgi:LPS sulfotransferase NodH
VEPARSYVICCVQRTGSWLLAHTLADTGYAGRPSDYFDEQERKTHTREWGEPGDLPSVRYRQQADRLTEHYVDLVHAVIGGRAGPR